MGLVRRFLTASTSGGVRASLSVLSGLLTERRSPVLDWSDNPYWLAFGLLGTVTFGSRFLVQWIVSERAGQSVVPPAFWYLSIAGSVILLAYAIHLRNPVFTIAYLPNAFIYLRNLVLIWKREQRGQAAA